MDEWGEERAVLNPCDAVFLLFFFLFFFLEQHNQKESFIHVQLPARSSRPLLAAAAADRKFWPALFSDVFGEKDAKPKRGNVC